MRSLTVTLSHAFALLQMWGVAPPPPPASLHRSREVGACLLVRFPWLLIEEAN